MGNKGREDEKYRQMKGVGKDGELLNPVFPQVENVPVFTLGNELSLCGRY